ncbi:unnamed protein product [Urochloa decumbens]|uniref:Uncharacterized protein n=1 Tax=Urochloa decumbens TaxID=240449 RepID=A0ABC9FYD5_9POAL
MAGKEASSKQCITGIMAGEDEVTSLYAAGNVAAAASIAEATGQITDATAPIGGCGSSEEEEKAPEERMTRLPQEEVDWILARGFHAPSDFEALRRSNPDLTPPPDEEMDESTKLLYDAAKIFYDGQESFFEFQEEVRQQYEEKGYVEVDDEYLATREYNRALILETWQEVCGGRVYSDDDEDEGAYYSDSDDEGVFADRPVSVMEAWLLRPRKL